MNNRERFLRTMRYEAVDHPPFMLPGGPWPAAHRRWQHEGLPKDVDLNTYFGVEPVGVRHVGIETVFWPPFKEVILEETSEFVVKIDHHGVKVRNFKDESSMPEHLDYPIKGPESLGWLKEKLDWNAPGRIRPDWLETARRQQEQGTIILINGGQYFALLNEHMGTERLMYAYADTPDFIHAVNELQCVLCENTLKMVLPHLKADYIGYHEDMGYKTASLISPDMFKEFMVPYYNRVTKITRRYGADIHWMDSDGNVEELIPLWLECGINLLAPCEAAAGMDVVRLRRRFGKDLRMTGGFDKRILASTKAAVKKEFERLRPVIEEGGYILACDHGVPPDVPFENYALLVSLLKSLYGLNG